MRVQFPLLLGEGFRALAQFLFTTRNAVFCGRRSRLDPLVPLGDLALPNMECLRRFLVLGFRLQDFFVSADQISLLALEDLRRRVELGLRLRQALLAGLEVRLRLFHRGFTRCQIARFRRCGSRALEVLREGIPPVGLGLELGLDAGEFGLEFDLAALKGLVGRMQRRLEAVDRLVALRNLAVAGLKKFASFVEFLRMRLLSRLFPFYNLFFRLP